MADAPALAFNCVEAFSTVNKYEDFVISMEPPSLVALAELIRGYDDEHPRSATIRAELLNLACEIEARMQHLAAAPPTAEEDWLK